jgi:flagellar basal body-associated protein FliL
MEVRGGFRMTRKMAVESEPQQKQMEEDKSTHTRFENILIVAVIVIITIMVVVATEGMREHWDKQEQIGKQLCEINKFKYNRLDTMGQTIVCETNITYNSEHYNLSPETLEITITPDWSYYLPKKGATTK